MNWRLLRKFYYMAHVGIRVLLKCALSSFDFMKLMSSAAKHVCMYARVNFSFYDIVILLINWDLYSAMSLTQQPSYYILLCHVTNVCWLEDRDTHNYLFEWNHDLFYCCCQKRVLVSWCCNLATFTTILKSEVFCSVGPFITEECNWTTYFNCIWVYIYVIYDSASCDLVWMYAVIAVGPLIIV